MPLSSGTRRSAARLGLAAWAAASLSVDAAGQQPVFRANAASVPVWATVQDRDGRLVPDLTRDDFEVRVGGRPQDIAVFSAEEQPITVVLLLDMSGSVQNRLLRIRDGSLHFVRALKPVDKARVGTFGDEIFISPILTNDHARLEQVLREELWPGGSTPLWGALGAAVDSLAGESGRRVVLILTDGAAQGTLPGYPSTYGDVRRRVTVDGVMLYAIGITGITSSIRTSSSTDFELDGDLEALVEHTGGGHFKLTDDANLESTFTRVAEELRRQYLIGFIPDAGMTGTQRIDVRVKKGGYRVRARRDFVAGARR